ncbi:TetR/AcrR family transcriptional regulator [Rhodococcoides fascians A25f]|uniref:TetR/AcrR family transcriptional regulator n=1 Tax=Rhodococcoides fascians TaxID=1828 RepID=UPI0009B8EEF5|nr:WHG domain-containing protein [Rhodococcus fascians]QII07245.1 TetR/AcrR family transcriptional regulator [Rhodococcus fascians A25f]
MVGSPDEKSALQRGSVRERLVEAAVEVLRVHGPGEMKVRRISEEAGASTIAVYHHFGDLQHLLIEVVNRGFSMLRAELLDAAASNVEPEVQLFSMALCVRGMARGNPHLYDMMFGLSTRGTYRAAAPATVTRKPFSDAYEVLARACQDLASSDRIDVEDGELIAAQLWSLVHGFVSLEAAGHFDDHGDAVLAVLAPMAVTHMVGFGEDRTYAAHSASTALEWWKHRDRKFDRNGSEEI